MRIRIHEMVFEGKEKPGYYWSLADGKRGICRSLGAWPTPEEAEKDALKTARVIAVTVPPRRERKEKTALEVERMFGED